MSDDGSSGLSDPADSPDEHSSPDELDVAYGFLRDNDTEASTERLEETPRKVQRDIPQHSKFVGNATTIDIQEVRTEDSDQIASNSLPFYINDQKDQDNAVEDLAPNDHAASYWSPTQAGGTSGAFKRKRSSSLTSAGSASARSTSIARIRSSSKERIKRAESPRQPEAEVEINSLRGSPACPIDDPDMIDPWRISGRDTPNIDDNVSMSPQSRRVKRRRESDERSLASGRDSLAESEAVEQAEKREEADTEENPTSRNAPEPQMDEGEEDEAEHEDEASKGEDEHAKKKAALEKLRPIETLFAIFRDKLFGEKLRDLASELEMLSTSPAEHPILLAQLHCLDTRRDEKFHLEDVALRYKLESLKRTTLAERAALHSQYFQEARDIRDRHMSLANEEFAKIQRERRHWSCKEPHFTYPFNVKRSAQIRLQNAYNQEVSILSGLARHKGFPAAPNLNGAGSYDIHEDREQLGLEPKPSSFVAQMANWTHREEMAGEQQFVEKNPWAGTTPAAFAQSSALAVGSQVSSESDDPHLTSDKHMEPTRIPRRRLSPRSAMIGVPPPRSSTTVDGIVTKPHNTQIMTGTQTLPGHMQKLSSRQKQPTDITAILHTTASANGDTSTFTNASGEQDGAWHRESVAQKSNPHAPPVQPAPNDGFSRDPEPLPNFYTATSHKSARDDTGVRDGERRYGVAPSALDEMPFSHVSALSTSAR